MANMELIGGPTGGQISSPASSITFSNIPQTYTDLKIVYSGRTSRSDGAADTVNVSFNGSTSNFSGKILYGTGSGSGNSSNTTRWFGSQNSGGSTSNTFANVEAYIPNYTSSNYKSVSVDAVTENNDTIALAYLGAVLWSDTAAITTITLTPETGNFVSGSTFYLYGISNVTSTTKATGGIVSSDGTYNYHMFPYSGTFTPTQSINADILTIAGGGGGGNYTGGGGGAGGLVYQTSQSLTATGYSVVIGAGGAGGTGGVRGTNGLDSTFNSYTATGGGGGSAHGTTVLRDGRDGGSGGGGGEYAGAGTGGTSTQASYSGTGFGNNGGAGFGGFPYAGGGGGGAGAVGATANSAGGGNGGIGKQYLDFSTATQTGANDGYYAGGGGGAPAVTTTYYGSGGTGGGGQAANPTGVSGTVNTGGGGGASGTGSSTGNGGTGGSGIVIIRYAI